jgi:hypothetical protein
MSLLLSDANKMDQMNWGDLVRDEAEAPSRTKTVERELLMMDQSSRDGLNMLFKSVRRSFPASLAALFLHTIYIPQ